MASGDIKILDKLSINQNVICLIISYIGIIYIADNATDTQNCFVCLTNCLCLVIFLSSSISVISSLVVYSIEYWAKKWYKHKSYQLHFNYKKKVAEQDIPKEPKDIKDICSIFDNK